MIYYDATNLTGIAQEIDALCDTDSTTYPILSKQRRINEAVREVEAAMLGSSGTWDYDGSNHQDLPIGEADLVDGQQHYSFHSTVVEVKVVRVKDNSGIWHKLRPFDKSEVGSAMDEYMKTNGLPRAYDKTGGSIFLYPAPATANVTLTDGLKVDFSRLSELITDLSGTDATKSPGFDVNHNIISYKAALPHCIAYKPERVAGYLGEIDRLMRGILDHAGRRMVDVKPRFKAGSVSAE